MHGIPPSSIPQHTKIRHVHIEELHTDEMAAARAGFWGFKRVRKSSTAPLRKFTIVFFEGSYYGSSVISRGGEGRPEDQVMFCLAWNPGHFFHYWCLSFSFAMLTPLGGGLFRYVASD